MERTLARLVLVGVICVFGLLQPARAVADDDGSIVSIGVDWVGQYTGTASPGAQYGNLSTTDECVAGLVNIANDFNTDWQWAFNWGNNNAWELDFKRPAAGGNAYRLADDVDLVAFAGHGTGNCFVFNNQNNDWTTVPSDLDLGLRDCEWMLTYTCNFLVGPPSNYGAAANGVHLICGYASDMTVTSTGGSSFAFYARPTATRQAYGVRVAWYKYGLASQSGANQNIARTFGARASANDYLWGYGQVSADPAPYSSATSANYTYWDTKLNW